MVDICLIPEVHFTEDKLMQYIERQLEKKGHIVICVAEGAGQVRPCYWPCGKRIYVVAFQGPSWTWYL